MTTTDHIPPATAHTPGPWHVHRLANGWPVITSDIHDIADLRLNGKGLPHVEANARRIVAAVNACQGIGTEALEQGVIEELLEALDYLLQQTVDMDMKYGIGLSEGEEDARAKALAAIGKARRRA